MAASSSEDLLLQLLARKEAVEAKQADVMRLIMLAASESLESGKAAPGDPEFTAAAARAEAQARTVLRQVAGSAEKCARMAAEYAAAPGGEALAEAMRRQAASAAALVAVAEECAAFMRDVGALMVAGSDTDSDSKSEVVVAVEAVAARPTCSRPRRPNAKYFGPEWSN